MKLLIEYFSCNKNKILTNKLNKRYKLMINRILLTLIFHIRILIKITINMKLSSPFLEYIPDCKRKMRRLRKKIYKYLTSKNQSKPTPKTKDLQSTLKQINLPLFLQDMLSKKKNIDMHAIRNINVSTKLSIEQMISLANKQQACVKYQHTNWQIEDQQRERNKIQNLYVKEIMSKRTISSTEQSEFGLDSYKEQSQSLNMCQSFYNQMNISTNRNGQFNPFIVQSGFLSMQSSVLSYQNLFK